MRKMRKMDRMVFNRSFNILILLMFLNIYYNVYAMVSLRQRTVKNRRYTNLSNCTQSAEDLSNNKSTRQTKSADVVEQDEGRRAFKNYPVFLIFTMSTLQDYRVNAERGGPQGVCV